MKKKKLKSVPARTPKHKTVSIDSKWVQSISNELWGIMDPLWQIQDKLRATGIPFAAHVPDVPDDENTEERDRISPAKEPASAPPKESTAYWMDLTGKAIAEMVEGARPLIEKLRLDPNSLTHDIWLCREGEWGTVREILVTRRGDPNDIIAYIDVDGDDRGQSSLDHPEKLESGPLFEDLCAAALIALYGGDAGEAAWDHALANKPGLINSHGPVPPDLYGRYFSRPFVNPSDLGKQRIIQPFCRFLFAAMLRQFSAKRFLMPGKHNIQVRQYIAGYIDPETGDHVVAIVGEPTEQSTGRQNDPTATV